ncbi:MAG TPA: cadherin-like beta sandwich domain-containing protein [Bacilli bacterium]|nr:cadherin-like beta sandwich domain-containing protein [Bacilli bacterium]
MKKIIKVLLLIFLLFVSEEVLAEPANSSFVDDNLYMCIIDAYNSENGYSKDYTYNILQSELTTINNLDCSSYEGNIDSLIGLNKLTGLTNLNLSGNIFYGPSLSLKVGSSSDLTSNLTLPSQIILTDITYSVTDSQIASVNSDGVVTGKSGGTTYVTMTAYTTGNIIQEKHLIVVSGLTEESTNNKLSSLSLSYGNIEFKSNINKYTISIPNSVNSITISAKLQDSSASFVSGYGPRTVSIKVGTSSIYVKVKAEDGSINVYTIGVIRSDGTDSDNLLSDIELSVGNIEFDPIITIYNFSVSSEIDNIEVLPITDSTLATYTVSDTALELGENKITIIVTAENGSEKVYELIVTREEYISQNNYLSDLIVENYNINFLKTTDEYELTIKSETSLNITASPEKSSSAVSVSGNKNLKDGSIITITVVDKDGLTREYVINIKKNILYSLTYNDLIIFGEFLLIFILLIIFIKIKKKNKKNKKEI